MAPNEWQVVKLSDFDKLKEQLRFLPRGDLFTLAVNPHNGNLVVRWQGSHEAITVLRSAFVQLMRQYVISRNNDPCHIIPFNRFNDLEVA